MNQRALIGRLLSPAGFGLVLLFFLLPFLTVSCGGGEERIRWTFTGIDMVVGSPPEVVGPGLDEEAAAELGRSFVAEEQDLEPLALLAALAALAGMAANLIRERLARHGLGTGLAVFAAALLVGAVLRAPARVDAAMRKVADGPTLTDPIPTEVETRYGFWLAIVGLGALAVGHAALLVRAWKAPAAPPEPQPAPLEADDYSS